MNAALEVAFATDVGKVRQKNEDSGWAEIVSDELRNPWRASGVLLVADGMGGHQAGEVASGLAAEFARRIFVEDEIDVGVEDEINIGVENENDILAEDENDIIVENEIEIEAISSEESVVEFETRLALDVGKINRAVWEEAGRAAGEGDAQPGTTFTLALLRRNEFFIAHIGDSRAYLIGADFSVRQITSDHSFVGEQIRVGAMTPEEARVSTLRNQVTRAMGLQADVAPEITFSKWQKHDVLLLCSDGLSEHVRDEEIGEIVGLERSLSRACQALIDLANERGGSDNISIAAARHKPVAAWSTPAGSTPAGNERGAAQTTPFDKSLQGEDGDNNEIPVANALSTQSAYQPEARVSIKDDARAQKRRARRRKNNLVWLAVLLLLFGALAAWGFSAARKRANLQNANSQPIAIAKRAAPAPVLQSVPVAIIALPGGNISLAARDAKYKINGKAESDLKPGAAGEMNFQIAASDLDGAILEICPNENCGVQALADENATADKVNLKLPFNQLFALCLRYEKTRKSRRLAQFRVQLKTQPQPIP